ncbi:50S ribosomal protein L3 [Patescibacteria group bacterium]
METLIKGKKLNMTQMFLDNGKVVPATIVKTEAELSEEMLDKKVAITGFSKGKGFTGVMKRWGFKGGPATHGQSNKPRSGGSIGSQTPGRVLKGKKMAGRVGNEKVTIKGLKILKVTPEKGEFMVSGPLPGARNGKLTIKINES